MQQKRTLEEILKTSGAVAPNPVNLTKEKTLIIGEGEIGTSLKKVLSNVYNVYTRDIQEPKWKINKFNVINVCYPYSDDFVDITKKYIEKYEPGLVIVHSTVEPGTTKKLGIGVVHSPINGKHPHLEKGIRTFVKFVGGNEIFSVYSAIIFLQRAGIRTQVMANSNTTELAKILCTTYYGWNLIFMKEVARICNELGLPFHEIYTEWNNAYNEGYVRLEDTRFIRPVLFPIDGPIGGHCVVPNCDLFSDFLTDTVKGRNQKYIKPPPKKGGKRVHSKSRKKHKDISSSSK